VSTSRPACAVLGALLTALLRAACGSDAGSNTNAAAGAGAGPGQRPGDARRGFLRDPKVVACLKKQGVTLPDRPRSGAGGGPPRSGQGGPPPSGQSRPDRRPDSAQMQKLRAALAKCGVGFGGGPPSGQQPPDESQGTSSTSAS
jgi:hypothetical protein